MYELHSTQGRFAQSLVEIGVFNLSFFIVNFHLMEIRGRTHELFLEKHWQDWSKEGLFTLIKISLVSNNEHTEFFISSKLSTSDSKLFRFQLTCSWGSGYYVAISGDISVSMVNHAYMRLQQGTFIVYLWRAVFPIILLIPSCYLN